MNNRRVMNGDESWMDDKRSKNWKAIAFQLPVMTTPFECSSDHHL
ncbi:MAG: hypothetical protein AAFU78_13075 [Cyanobacteria bacterium J06633_2]